MKDLRGLKDFDDTRFKTCTTRDWTRTQMRPSKFCYYFALDYSKYYCSDSECELTFEVNLPTNLGELTFKDMSK
jgi:hypothetical protein